MPGFSFGLLADQTPLSSRVSGIFSATQLASFSPNRHRSMLVAFADQTRRVPPFGVARTPRF